MRIISKAHDYYDIGLSYGVDKSLVYLRKPRQVEDKNLTKRFPVPPTDQLKLKRADRLQNKFWNNRGRYQEAHVDVYIVSLCNETYYVYRACPNGPRFGTSSSQALSIYLSWSELWEDIREEPYKPTAKQRAKVNEVQQDCLELHQELGTPILVTEVKSSWDDNITKFWVDYTLKDLEFYRVVDPYQAFQKISMFMGGVLSGLRENELVEISDEDQIAKKGFDKWSFRKKPQ